MMPFSFANALGSFQHFINNTLCPYLDVFCTAYINNILVYSNSIAEHQKHVKLILQALCGAGLQLNVDKCKFYKTEILYLGFIIFTNGIQMDPKKIEAIVNWQKPENVKNVKAFIGLLTFINGLLTTSLSWFHPL